MAMRLEQVQAYLAHKEGADALGPRLPCPSEHKVHITDAPATNESYCTCRAVAPPQSRDMHSHVKAAPGLTIQHVGVAVAPCSCSQ